MDGRADGQTDRHFGDWVFIFMCPLKIFEFHRRRLGPEFGWTKDHKYAGQFEKKSV